MTQIDVSPLVPEVREVARQASASYLKHLEPWLRCLLIHGSAMKGGFIPHASDLDFQAYLDDAAFGEDGQIPVEASLAIAADLAKIDLGIVDYVQCFPLRLQGRSDWTSPIPGTYHVVAGVLPVAPASAEEMIHAAHQRLSTLQVHPFDITNGLLDAGQARLDRLVRLLSTEVWPTLYQVLTCLTSEPLRVWCLPKEQAIKLLPPGQSPRTEIESFYAAVLERTKERSPERSLQVIRKGLVFLAASRAWYASGPPAEPGSPSVRQAGSESRTQARERGLLLLGCVVFSVLVAVIVLIGIITALHPHLF